MLKRKSIIRQEGLSEESRKILFGICQTFGGAGDLLVSCMLMRYQTKGKDVIIMDHPTEVGLIIYEKNGVR